MMQKKISLSGSTAWYTIGNLFVRSVSFLLLPLYSNFLTPFDFGNYALLMSLYAIVSVLYQAGLQSSLTKYYLGEISEEKRKNVFSTTLNFLILSGVILTIPAFIFSTQISFLIFNYDYSDFIRIIFIAILFETLAYHVLHLLKTKELSKKVVIYSGVTATVNLFFNVWLVYYLGLKVEGILYAQLFSSIFLLIFLSLQLRSNYKLLFDKALLRLSLLFAFPLIIANLLTAGVDYIDRFILNYFLGTNEVGVYSFSYRIAMLMYIFVISFRTAWVPYGIRLYNSGNYKEAFGKTFNKLIASGLFLFLLVSLLADDLFDLNISGFNLFNMEYRGGLVILPFILAAYLFNGIAAFYSIAPYTMGRSSQFLLSDLVAFVLNILMNFILIPFWGLIGAAVATFIAFTGGAIYLYFYSKNLIKINYDLKVLTTLIFAAIVFLLTGYSLDHIISDVMLILLYFLSVRFILKLEFRRLFSFARDH